MSLPERLQKIKGFFAFREGQIAFLLQLLVIFGVALGAYALGANRQSIQSNSGVSVFSPSAEPLPMPDSEFQDPSMAGEVLGSTDPASNAPGEKKFLASSKGTKYHRVDCPGAQTIKEENRIYFSSEDEARKAGFTPAGNCPGLE